MRLLSPVFSAVKGESIIFLVFGKIIFLAVLDCLKIFVLVLVCRRGACGVMNSKTAPNRTD
jgi:hypothetical protein